MAGRGKIPKQWRARHGSPGAATLPSEAASRRRKVPPLPPRERDSEVWHPQVLAWWAAVWQSPMAGEFLAPDVKGGLYLLAELYHRRWSGCDAKQLIALAAEIRLSEARFGLSAVDRRRLQWTIEQGEVAAERTAARRRAQRLDRAAATDPRAVLGLVK